MRVALATGRPVTAVAEEPFALTLWTQLHVAEVERQSRLEHRFARLDGAFLGAIAFHQPEKLDDARRRLEREVYDVDQGRVDALATEIITAVRAHDAQRALAATAGGSPSPVTP